MERNVSASKVTPKKSLKEKIERTTLHPSLTVCFERSRFCMFKRDAATLD